MISSHAYSSLAHSRKSCFYLFNNLHSPFIHISLSRHNHFLSRTTHTYPFVIIPCLYWNKFQRCKPSCDHVSPPQYNTHTPVEISSLLATSFILPLTTRSSFPGSFMPIPRFCHTFVSLVSFLFSSSVLFHLIFGSYIYPTFRFSLFFPSFFFLSFLFSGDVGCLYGIETRATEWIWFVCVVLEINIRNYFFHIVTFTQWILWIIVQWMFGCCV